MKPNFYWIVCFVLLSLLCADYTADVLRRETGTRALGMGGAFTAISDDTSALFYNPAGLAKPGYQLSYSEDDLNGKDNTRLGVETALKFGTFAYSRKKFVDHELNYAEIFSYGFGVRDAKGIDYGLAFKKIVQENPDRTGSSWAADIGTIVHWTEHFTMGLNAQNFSASNTSTRPSYRAGTAYQWETLLFLYDVEVFNQFDTPNAPQSHYGMEWALTDGFALRFGVNDKKGTIGFSAGFLGFIWDYAVEQQDRETIYRFSTKLGSERYPETRKYSIAKRKEFLSIDLNDTLIAGRSEYSFFGGSSLGADYLINKIRQASEDKDIAGIILKVGDIPNSLTYAGLAQEIRTELMRFKSKGKYLIVYVGSEISANTYYMISGADKIVMPGMGAIVALGKSITVTRYKGFLEKIGLDFQVVKTGAFKDALNPWNAGYTEEQRQHITSLVEDINDQIIYDIKEARKISDYDFAEIKDGGIISAKQALSYKLVDELGYYEKAVEAMKRIAALDYDPEIIKMADIPSYEIENSIFPDYNSIAVVDVDGEIVEGESKSNFLFGGKIAGSETICEELKKIGEKDYIKAVVVRINSPGGSPIAADKIYQKLLELKNKKKYIVISMGNVAASGGYYIAAAGDKIVANKGTLTGSIGVIGEVLKASKLYEMLNIKEETIKTGEHMDMGSIGTVLTAEQKQMLQKYQQEIYDQFKLVVATGRNMHVDEVERLAQGKIYSGKKAKELKLVDELGSIYDAIDLAKTGANITGKAKIIRVIKVNDDWFVLNSKTAALLGLDQIQLKNLVKQNMVELNSHIY